jgi:diaminohydroxyphosphoribosylaminopyrimidine deaminase / 5-amino-6-(5-phosphoribosylamino)uracil reductase
LHEAGRPETHAEPSTRDLTGSSVAAAWDLLLALARRAQRGDPLAVRTVFALQRGGRYEPTPSACDGADEARGASCSGDASPTRLALCIDPEGPSVLVPPADLRSCWEETRTSSDAHTLLELMLPLVVGRRARSLVVGHLGQSLDGRVATPTGASKFITGREDILHTHRLRALFDAVIVGVRTVQLDDPQLTTRLVSGSHPTRVVLDPQGKLRAGFKVLDDGASPTLICTSLACAPAPRRVGQVWWLGLPCPNGRFELGKLRQLLAARGLSRLFVEGGGFTVSGFLAARALDRLHVSVAPLILGSGAPAFKLPEIDQLDEALSLRCRHFALGRDVLFDCELSPALHGLEAE